jgi:hypothetical protein
MSLLSLSLALLSTSVMGYPVGCGLSMQQSCRALGAAMKETLCIVNSQMWLKFTRYGLDGPGNESRWGEIFRTRPDRPWGPPTLLYNGHRVSFPGCKAARAWRWPPTPSSAEVKERVELYLYSYGPSWPVIGWPLPFTYLIYIFLSSGKMVMSTLFFFFFLR